VGHEVDVSLCDLAADRRAATPTDAASIVVPHRIDLRAQITQYEYKLDSYLNRIFTEARSGMHAIVHSFSRMMELSRNRVESQQQHLSIRVSDVVDAHTHRVSELTRVLHSYNPAHALQRGYAIVRSARGVVAAEKIKPGDGLVIELAQHTIDAEVKDVQQK